ncbi:FAD-dependent oxidoreductase [Paenibacillus puldeungensis]|uniref:Urocanate reductase n=1 Tax=Paenibacillus puldeungensis TaxID=696536 RepID=A0ABW3RSQ7_9BACL
MQRHIRKIARPGIMFLVFTLVFLGCYFGNFQNSAVGAASKASPSYKAGTYTSTVKARNGDLKVKVTFTSNAITDITVVEESETEGLGKPALKKIADEILSAQHLNVDVVSGATSSSKSMLEAVAAAVKQAGGNVDALKKAKKATVVAKNEEMTTDVVVVGGGASGTAAALAAAEKGAKVVVLEKAATPGGAGRFLAEGLLAIQSDQQKKAGETYTVDQAFDYLTKYTHYLSNGELTRNILEQSASTIDWLAKYGTETKLMENTQKSHIGLPVTYHKYVDKNKAFDNMYAKLKEMGGTLLTNTAGKELIKDQAGNIIGVIAQKADGGKLTVHAKKVVLATGGYAGSDAMIKKYLNVSNYTTMAYANNTGDGLTMAQAVGADDFNINAVAVHSALIPSKDPSVWQGSTGQLLNLPLMWVNREGKRFVDEGVVYDFALWGNAAVAQGGEYYVVLDDATMKQLSEQGSDLTNSFEKTYLVGAGVDTKTSTGKVAPMKDLYDSMDKTIKAGAAFKGNTIEELAKNMGVDAANLVGAAADYSKSVKSGKDSEFLKNPAYMKYSVEKGPFYAVQAAALVEDSIGGIRVNGSLQVMNGQFKPISGLYAVGCDAGGLYGDSYPTFEGLTLSFAFNSGRLGGYAAASSMK